MSDSTREELTQKVTRIQTLLDSQKDILSGYEGRLAKLEDKYTDLAVTVASINTKMSIIGIIGTLGLGSTLTVLFALLLHL